MALQNNNFSVHTLAGSKIIDSSVLEIILKKIFPLQRKMHVNFSINISFKLTRKKVHVSISGLVIDAFFMTLTK